MDNRKVRLGKKNPRRDARTLQLKKYIVTPVPHIPDEVSWVTHVSNWPMYLNDSLGDCVIAAAAHMIEQWSLYAQQPALPTDDQVLSAYQHVGGYVPGDPTTDNGCFMLDALRFWRNTGIAGHQIRAFLGVDPKNLDEVRAAVYLFGNLYAGLSLPAFAQDETAAAAGWTVALGGPFGSTGSPGGWGGHCVPIVAMSPLTLTCVTWGQTLKMSHNFFLDYCDEAYAVLSDDWIETNGLSPGSFDLAALQADLAQL
jgi:hypothetical protein